MPCYSPLRGVLQSSPQGRKVLLGGGGVGKGITLPCGSCIGCKLERARQWAVRLMHESKLHDESSFLTLTYDGGSYPADGSLDVPTCQKFIKRLRERIRPVRIRFFLAGEYGERLGRPHYHAIVFGFGFPDKVYFKGSGELSLYTSRVLSESWGHGFASVGSVSFDSAMYVANYATKKISTNREDEAKRLAGRRAEFLIMSRGGRNGKGIGSGWIERYSRDVYPSDSVIVRGRECRPPRFYDEWVAKERPEVHAEVVARREAAQEVLEREYRNGFAVDVVPSRNMRRLAVRESVARAKLALKRREMEA